MARATPRGPPVPATAEDQNEETFTTVMSKSARRKLRLKEGRVCPSQGENPSVELPRRAPDVADEEQVTPSGPPVPEKDTAKDTRMDQEDKDMDEDGDARFPLPEWRLKSAGSFPSFFSAIEWLEKKKKILFDVVRVSPTGEYIIRANSWDEAISLSMVEEKQPEGIVIVLEVKEVRCVLLGYPVYFPLDPILAYPLVSKATRCMVSAGRGRRLPTRSVVVTLRGKIPPSLDLESWGRYTIRKFVPEPLRCFRCQAFGHHQRNCERTVELCGVCGGDHPTRSCRDRVHDSGKKPEPLCVNCGARHFAWHRSCPARLRRIKGAGLPTRSLRGRSPLPPAVENLPPADVGPGPRKQNGDRRRRRRRGKRSGTSKVSLQPPPLSTPGIEASTPRPTVTPVPETTTRTSVGAGAVQKEPRKVDQTKLGHRSRPTQTRGCWSFSEAELEDLLIRFEHLLAQERVAQESRTSHEPALCCTKRHLREGRQVPHTLPVGRPLSNPPRCRYHRGEKDWIHYKVVSMVEKEKTQGGDEKDPSASAGAEENISVAEARVTPALHSAVEGPHNAHSCPERESVSPSARDSVGS